MSKPVASTVAASARRARILRRALGALALLPAIALSAPLPTPVLRPAERIDLRRTGNVGEEERALLRVEWRAAQSADDEAQSVGRMLDSLRRMEGTVAELGRLMRALPARGAVAPPIATDDAEATLNPGLLAAAAGILVALAGGGLLRRRRKAASAPEMPRTEPPRRAAAPRVDPLPLTSPVAEAPPTLPPAATAPPAREAVVATDRGAAATFVAGSADGVAAPDGAPDAVPPAPTIDEAAVDLSSPGPMTIDFSLEEEEPDVVARANARVPVLRKRGSDSHVPERRQELNVEPTLQLAEIMLSMGLQQGAAQALVEYAEANPRQAVYHWLKLLAIYREGGQHEDFAQTADKLRRHFNIRAGEFASADAGSEGSLENFPRILTHVEEIWRNPAECVPYLRHLLEDNREGSRTGFPQPVAEDILLLIELLGGTAAPGGPQSAATTTS